MSAFTSDSEERETLRGTFDDVAEVYDRARPPYPPALLDDLAQLAGIGPGCRILEIGCGTGQLTVPMAERGSRIVALELGPNLAAVARRNLATFPAVEVLATSFERWPLPGQRFDAVVCATAFHWLDPEIRVRKAADALRPGGALAVIVTHHVVGGTEGFFAESQDCYLRWDPSTEPGFRLPHPNDVPIDTEELDRSRRFGPVDVRRYEWELDYSAATYLDLLSTFSNHRSLPQDARSGLLRCLQLLIDERFGGRITKRYLIELLTARLST